MLLNLDSGIEEKQSGYRLHSLEVLDWGTFDQHVWTITPKGENALLTGDIGSGKSTLVDAITTLLVPYQKITYNKAAGADSRERSLLSYIRGAYKNEKVDSSSKARDVYLRTGQDHFTVLLAVFSNEGYGQPVTLAQVLWLQNSEVRKFYVLAENEMSIVEDFSNFGDQVKQLKRKLRNRAHTFVFNTFTDYANRFRQIFGIRQPEALDLFYQTVSMKSVGNLTDFVRERMLGQTDIKSQIDDLVSRYGDLTESHRAVQRAREQSELLQPLVAEADQLESVRQQINALEATLEELPRYFAERRIRALQRQLEQLYSDWQQNEEKRKQANALLRQQRQDLARLERARAGLSVNQQLEHIRLELEQQQAEKQRRQQQAGRYRESYERLRESYATDEAPQLGMPTSADQFLQQRQWAGTSLEDTNEQIVQIRSRQEPLHVRIARLQESIEEIEGELHSLRKRPTQIPQRNLQLRARLLTALNLEMEELPFVGELLQVRENEKAWEGAIERQLHSLGLSILVPDRHYRAVSSYVDRHHLGGKLVYLRTLEHRRPPREEPAPNSLVRKVRIRVATEFYDWLETELRQRYDYTCCETMEEFRQAARGLTRSGQSKSGRVTHTKDDRYDVHDRRRYILGWSNEEKIAALEQSLNEAEQERTAAQSELTDLRRHERLLNERRDGLKQLLQFTTWEDIHFQVVALRIQELQTERQRLEAGSEELRELQERIRTLEAAVAETDRQIGNKLKESGALENKINTAVQQILQLLDTLDIQTDDINIEETDITQLKDQFVQIQLPDLQPSALLRTYLATVADSENADTLARTQSRLQEKIGGSKGDLKQQNDAAGKLERTILMKMKTFRDRYPEETLDVDADMRSIPQFREVYQRLLEDDIPRHEARFRQQLRQGTIQGILSFRSQLEAYEQEIAEKIEQINTHLYEIDYTPGTYIRIAKEDVRTEDILTFKQDLRACLSNVYGNSDDLYTEEKFFQVKKLLDRFCGDSEEDVRWTKRVTDVRQWYSFGAEERIRDTDERKEYFSDSSGKSGGQKEKLAYTILASAIAFQFGLAEGHSRDRTFRFVLIDEAFGRGSDDSTRYGLELFERLKLQLLIVTPLQKINVIEDYISAVHYVSNPDGRNSMVRNISKAEYLQEKAEYYAKQSADL